MTNKKVDETGKKENKRDEDNFSDMLDDTDGFNKLLSQLKQEKIEDEKEFENNKNNYNNLFISIEKKLDINNDETKIINEFNELMKKEEKKKEASEHKEKDSLNAKICFLIKYNPFFKYISIHIISPDKSESIKIPPIHLAKCSLTKISFIH